MDINPTPSIVIYWGNTNIMEDKMKVDKKFVALVAAVVLGVVSYFFGADAVHLVKSAVSETEVAPVTSASEAPVSSSD